MISTLTQMLKDASSDEIILQALYTIVNVVTGRDEHKNFIMNSFEILQRIMQFMASFLFIIQTKTRTTASLPLGLLLSGVLLI